MLINDAQKFSGTKLRVLVVGLFYEQFKIVVPEFPELDLRHMGGDKNDNKNDAALVGACDHYICMTRFSSHARMWRLDKRKTTFVHGALSELRRVLRKLADTVVLSLPVLSTIPTDEATLARANDFGAVCIANIGQVLTFTRREREPAHVFIQAAHAARDMFRRQHGVHSTLEVTSNKATFTVTDANGSTIRVPVLEAAEALLLEKSERRPPRNMLAKLAPLWRRVFTQSQLAAPYSPVEFHAAVASKAVGSWLSYHH